MNFPVKKSNMTETVARTVLKLKMKGEDFSWYPTTDEIIKAIRQDLFNLDSDVFNRKDRYTLLDVGAGDGRVLHALSQPFTSEEFPNSDIRHKGNKISRLCGIEKSSYLRQFWDLDIKVIGADLFNSTLIDKDVDIVYSNVPFDNFCDFTCKIVNECTASVIYLTLPIGWRKNKELVRTLRHNRYDPARWYRKFDIANKDLDAGFKSLGIFDFSNGDRPTNHPTRAEVIRLRKSTSVNTQFKNWYKENFVPKDEEDISIVSECQDVQKREDARSLVQSYDYELSCLIDLYKTLQRLPTEYLMELEISSSKLRDSLKSKISSLKVTYWNKLFDNYEPIRRRLIDSELSKLKEQFLKEFATDFNLENIYAITEWVIKFAAKSLDTQFIETFDKLVDLCNVVKYKSNEKVFKDQNYRFNSTPNRWSHFKLEYRIVSHNVGGTCESTSTGASFKLTTFINDLLVIARNLSIDTTDVVLADERTWERGKYQDFECKTKHGGFLFQVKAYNNGNAHIRFSQKFMMQMNVLYGRLKGWLHTPEEASDEMGYPLEEVSQVFEISHSYGGTIPETLLLTAN